MSGGNPANHELLEAYLDGRLTGAALAEFERRVAADPALRAQVELQHSIDGSLSRRFSAPASFGVREGAAPVSPSAPDVLKMPARASRRVFILLGVAAALVLTGAGLWYAGVIDASMWSGGGPPRVRLVDPERAYHLQEASQFQPDFKCEDDKAFAAWVRARYAHELLVKPESGLEVTGWTYYRGSSVLSSRSALLLTKVDGKDVIVVMDHARNDRKLSLPASSGLHLFKRIISGVVLYEISPLGEQKVLPRFYDPQDPSTLPPS